MKKLSKFFEKIRENKKWTLFFYYKDQLVSKRKVIADEKPFDNFYILNIYGKKHLFGTNRKVTIVAKPILLKYTDANKKHIHIEIQTFEGVRAYE